MDSCQARRRDRRRRGPRCGLRTGSGNLALPADCPPIDRITWLRIITLQIRNETDPAKLSGQVQAMLQQVKQLTDRRCSGRLESLGCVRSWS